MKSWLKEKGIHCKSTEKKDELVKKVQVFLGIYQEELKQQIRVFVAGPVVASWNVSLRWIQTALIIMVWTDDVLINKSNSLILTGPQSL